MPSMDSEFAYPSIDTELLQIVEWNMEPRWVRFSDGRKRLVKPGTKMLVARDGEDSLAPIELIILH